MKLELNITTPSDYFNNLGKEIDWEETGNKDMVSMEEYESMFDIIACECSIWVLRRTTRTCGSIISHIKNMRRKFIEQHNEKFTEYIENYDCFN